MVGSTCNSYSAELWTDDEIGDGLHRYPAA